MDLPSSGTIGLAPIGHLEVVGNNYVRQPVRLVPTPDRSGVTNAEAIVWPIAFPLRWGEIDRVRLWDAAGHPAGNAALFPHVTIEAHQSVRIKPGALTVLADGPSVGSPYGMRRYGMGRYATIPGLRFLLDSLDLTFDLVDPCEDGIWEPELEEETEWVPIAWQEAPWEWVPADEAASAWDPYRVHTVGYWEAVDGIQSTPWNTTNPCTDGVWGFSGPCQSVPWEPVRRGS